MYFIPIIFGTIFLSVYALSGKKKGNQNMTGIIEQSAILAIDEIKEKEGLRLDVYLDTLNNPTVGYGHLVTNQDGLKVGDEITQSQADEFLNKDFQKAFNAAVNQAQELNKILPEFIAALTSVNYQLGVNWRNKFKNTWGMLKSGDINMAISNLKASKWNEQTPVRVTAFISSIQNTYA